jgi:hypothetical protein
VGLRPRIPDTPADAVISWTIDTTAITADMTTPTADGLWLSATFGTVAADALPRLTASMAIEV